MSRPRSQKVSAIKAKLIAGLNDGFRRPGDRFLSARKLATKHEVSYQTAHRIIAELETEGLLKRRESSGTFVAGKTKCLRGVELWFHPRAMKAGRFGAHLLQLLTAGLADAGIKFSVHWARSGKKPANDFFPVIWDAPEILNAIRPARQYALLLNNRPTPGLQASLIDAVTTDDFSAGVCAAEVFLGQSHPGKHFAVIAGPRDDERSANRVAGFLKTIPQAKIFNAGSWYPEALAGIADWVLDGQPDGIFCVNDRLAERVLVYCRKKNISAPPLIGHDNAPVAEELHLTTIETPWDEMISSAVEVTQKRLGGYSGPARLVFLAQRPVFRLSHQKQLSMADSALCLI